MLSIQGQIMSQPPRSDDSRSPRIEILDDATVAMLRAKTPTERLAMVFDAERAMRSQLEGEIRTAHPDWDDKAVMQEIARRFSLL
jgi:hypothetical protein